jgi:ubiquinone/menaquinone biosynthesis C-methylase UbiE
VFLNPKSILEKVKIPHGARVADFGAGAGHYAIAIAERLEGGGTVYAIDAHQQSLDTLSRQSTERGLGIYTLVSDLNQHIPLKDNLLTFGVAANVLHQLSDRKRFVQELARVIAPDGEVLVVDWMSSFNNMGPTKDAVITPAEAADLFRSHGFTVGEVLPAGTHHFAFIATGHTP